MKLADFNRLKGLMAMTGSDSNNEALQAIRAANRVLFANGLTWEMVFGRTVSVITAVEVVGDSDDEMSDLFDKALRGADGSFRSTLLSIQAQYEAKGFLTPRQREVVEAAAERTAERHPGGRFR